MTTVHQEANEVLKMALAKYHTRPESMLATQLAIAQARNSILREQLESTRYALLVVAFTVCVVAFTTGMAVGLLRGTQ